MSTLYPGSLDNFTNPTSSTPLAPVHAGLHADNNDAIEALEAKVGANGSAVTTTIDYKLSGITGSDKAVSKTGTETLSGKTLTSPQINFTGDTRGDFIVRNASGITSRFPVGSTNQILQAGASGDPEWVANPAASNASTTIKGVAEEATLAEMLARTGTGGTSARLFVSPTTILNTQTYDYAADAGSTDAYAVTVTPDPVAYFTGQVFRFKANTLNTGTATLNVNGLGVKTLKKVTSSGVVALGTGDIIANQIIECMYNGTDLIIMSAIPTTLQYGSVDSSYVSRSTNGTTDSTTSGTVTNTKTSRFLVTFVGYLNTAGDSQAYTITPQIKVNSTYISGGAINHFSGRDVGQYPASFTVITDALAAGTQTFLIAINYSTSAAVANGTVSGFLQITELL